MPATTRGQAGGQGRRAGSPVPVSHHRTVGGAGQRRGPPPRPRADHDAPRPPASATASSAPTGQPAVPGHDHGHRVGASRPDRRRVTGPPPPGGPRSTAAWARRGARQSPTGGPEGCARQRPPQVVLGLLVDGADHPVAAAVLVGPGRVVLEREHDRPRPPSLRGPDTPIGTRSTLWPMPLAWALTFHVSMSRVMPEILADDHRRWSRSPPRSPGRPAARPSRWPGGSRARRRPPPGPRDGPGPRARRGRRPPGGVVPGPPRAGRTGAGGHDHHVGRLGRAPSAAVGLDAGPQVDALAPGGHDQVAGDVEELGPARDAWRPRGPGRRGGRGARRGPPGGRARRR